MGANIVYNTVYKVLEEHWNRAPKNDSEKLISKDIMDDIDYIEAIMELEDIFGLNIHEGHFYPNIENLVKDIEETLKYE